MQSNEVRQKFLKFFEERGHKVVPSSSLVPTDLSVLFTTAGMQQFKEYYTNPEQADKDFGSRNTVSVQKCVRTTDIDEVGDDTHLTFFEMLGNFSFGYKPGEQTSPKGGYFKREAITWAYEFITKEMGLEVDYVSVFAGDEITPKDEESIKIWQEIDPSIKIKEEGREDVFWGPTGDEGPCGPTTEIYVNGVEIWNIVFNEYYKTRDGKYEDLETKGVDTGMGLERLLVQVEKKENLYQTDLFADEKSKQERIVADHTKAAMFMVSDGIVPDNAGAGYILRRLIRRAVRFADSSLQKHIDKVKKVYEGVYEFKNFEEIEKEEKKFKETLSKGMKEFEKGTDAFTLFTTYGFPLELTQELAEEKGVEIDVEEFNRRLAEHQKLSQTASAGMFKGGLANEEPETIKLHTAHHLLLAGLQEVVSADIVQRGSNIDHKRLRIDFAFDRKLTDEEKEKVEDWVNEKIKMNLNMVRREMPLAEAKELGAQMEFGAKYPDTVSVYFLEDDAGKVYSKEFCGGPHIKNTSELGKFKIKKEQASSRGVRRIKAILI